MTTPTEHLQILQQTAFPRPDGNRRKAKRNRLVAAGTGLLALRRLRAAVPGPGPSPAAPLGLVVRPAWNGGCASSATPCVVQTPPPLTDAGSYLVCEHEPPEIGGACAWSVASAMSVLRTRSLVCFVSFHSLKHGTEAFARALDRRQEGVRETGVWLGYASRQRLSETHSVPCPSSF